MSVVPITTPSTSPPTIDAPAEGFTSRTAHATATRVNNALLVTAEGEIDAANAEEFAAYVVAQIVDADRLVVDLSHIKFFGTHGFSALHTINVRVAAAGTRWAVANGPALARILRICDPASALPVVRTVDAALAVLQREQAPLLQLVAQTP